MVSTGSTTIKRLLVANRGEIARRVFRTCRELGIETVAVHSDADAGLAFVQEADARVALPGNSATETYLRADLVIEAAKRAGADAVHPGYGFLSESAEFARAVRDAGLTWVGPDPESIEAMGSKVAAKKLMADAGVPVLAELSPSAVTEADLPVLVKASAGGGGRGMRVVRTLDALGDEVARAEAEALSAFGDGTVFLEPYVEQGRHVEVQVLGDAAAQVSVLGDRDCSVQRRHQKVVEEAPAPGIPDEVRRELHEAARKAAEAIRYVGAGTVEFLYDPARQQFWFLEMNTRLQVEHPVTECVLGVDLVALQIAAAEGARDLDLPTQPRGHAVEVRLYAEDPASDWQPQSGRLTRFDVPDAETEFSSPLRHGVRLDTGFRSGDEVSTHYDAMLAKVVAWGPSRGAALRRLAGVLRRTKVHGIRTNRDLLVGVLTHPAFVAADLGTDFLDRHDLTSPTGPAVDEAALAAALALAERARLARPVQQGIPAGWRNVVSQPQLTRFVHGSDEVEARWHGLRHGFAAADLDVTVREARPDRVTLEKNGVATAYEISVDGDSVDVDSPHGHVALTRKPRFTDPADQVVEGSLVAPMPGSVVSVAAAVGDRVESGRPVLVLEAMKMQHTITAPYNGTVDELSVAPGDQVSAGAVLAVIHPDQQPEQESA